MGCSSPECQKNVEGMRKTLYGQDGKTGLTACMQRKVSWSHFGFILPVMLILLVGLIYRNLDASQNALRERADNKQQIQVIQKDLEHIKETNQELKKGQNQIRKDVQEFKEQRMTPEMFRQILKDEINRRQP